MILIEATFIKMTFLWILLVASSQILLAVNSAPVTDEEKDMKELKDLMLKCNESNPIDPEYLIQLNLTGSFPDESVESAKCFVHCMYVETKLMDKNGQLHADKIKDVFKIHQSPAVTKQADLEMFVDMCIVKDAGETNPCERAYRFSKCLMTEPEMFGRLEEEVEEEGGTIREMITSFLKDMGSTVLAVLNILNEVREVVAAALSG